MIQLLKSGGTFTGKTDISGGSGDNNGTVNGNMVTINGGTFTGEVEITGGDFSAVTSLSVVGASPFDEGITQNNTINILTSLNMNELFGGMGETSTGNTLNIGAKNNSTGDLYGFQNMNFLLPADTVNGDTMLTFNSGYQTNLKGVTFGVSSTGGLNLNVGDEVTLITNGDGLVTDLALKTVNNLTYTTGLSTDTTFSIEKEGTESIAVKVKGKNIAERTKSLSETRGNMASVVNNGSDFLVSNGLEQAEFAVSDDIRRIETDDIYIGKGARVFVPFAAVGGGKLRTDSGSHVDTSFINMDLGLARKLPNRRGTLLYGPVVEYGRGSYDSYLESGVHGWGGSSYVGGGFFAKQTNRDGLYYEASLRAGQVKADYKGHLLRGLDAWYDTRSSYLAAHVKLGKIFNLNNADNVDTYFKYLFSRIGSDDVTVGSTMNSELYYFDPVNSHRIQLGFRYTHALNKNSNLYGGLAWQYEFDGEANAVYNGMNTPSPSLKGSSGMVELGWQVKPSAAPMTIDIGINGWFGKQKGINGGLKIDWQF